MPQPVMDKSTAFPSVHEPLHDPVIGQLQVAELHVTFEGEKLQITPFKLSVTVKNPPFMILLVRETPVTEIGVPDATVV